MKFDSGGFGHLLASAVETKCMIDLGAVAETT